MEKYLVGVISLPAGVFQPYSGVKTSILWLDKVLAKKTDKILFVKIENDGFDLGAQRRSIKENDLPIAFQLMSNYRNQLASDIRVELESDQNISFISKNEISGNGDFNLSGERYRRTEIVKNAVFPSVKIGEVCSFDYGKPLKQEDRLPGDYPVFGSNGIVGYHNAFLVEAPFIVVGRKGSAGEVHFSEKNGFPIDTTFYIKLNNENRIKLRFLFHVLKSIDLKNVNVQAGVPGLNRNDAYDIPIPLPTIPIQEEIVSEIDSYQKIIDGARMIVENYKPRIDIDPEWEMVELGELLSFVSSGSTPKGGKEVYTNYGVLFIRSQNILNGFYDFSDCVYISKEIHDEMNRSKVKFGDVFLNITGASIGRSAVMDREIEANVNQHVALLRCQDKLKPEFLSLYLNSDYGQKQILSMQAGASREALNYSQIKQIKVPLPPLDKQLQIISEMQREQALITGSKQLMEVFEKKIKDRIAKVWEE